MQWTLHSQVCGRECQGLVLCASMKGTALVMSLRVLGIRRGQGMQVQ